MSALQSEATPGEDEMNPTVKRSGWHPPEDTGLWAIADRVALQVICLNLVAKPDCTHALEQCWQIRTGWKDCCHGQLDGLRV